MTLQEFQGNNWIFLQYRINIYYYFVHNGKQTGKLAG